MAARRLLKHREGEVAKGEVPGTKVERTRFEDLAEDFLNDYQANGRKSLRRGPLAGEGSNGNANMKRQDSEDRYFNLVDLAAYSSLSVRRLRGFLRDPMRPLPHFRPGGPDGKVLVKRSEFDGWMEKHRQREAAQADLSTHLGRLIAEARPPEPPTLDRLVAETRAEVLGSVGNQPTP
jgi:hypothetical protein